MRRTFISKEDRRRSDAEVRENSAQPSRGLIFLLALTCALSVANVYFAHPLLDVIAGDLGLARSDAGLVVTLTQTGYALGLILLVPLGDLLEPRRLIVGLATASSVVLAVAASAPTAPLFLGAMAIVGLLAVLVQVVIAFAVSLARPDERGNIVGTVTSGVVIGILLARTVSGVLGDLHGWRSVYYGSAALMLLLAALLMRALPSAMERRQTGSYWQLLKSIVPLLREEPLLRTRALFALLIFAALNVLWAPLSLFLSAPPFAYSHTAVGLFGLVGIAGVLGARRAGQWADQNRGQFTTLGALVLMLIAWFLIAMAGLSIWALIGGVIVLNLAIQAVHVTNQALIFRIQPEAHSRRVGCYMVFYSIGSATGAFASTTAFEHAGWRGVCALGIGISITAMILLAATWKSAR
ncbi:MFS transporter [Bradyrhizobium icense]|uniref:Transporter n=1 Tax=Bradyrhizobium icense TaxID=1274631 RepID=A0A1B1UBM0_9BRAD|nr:MFS transporter [Bradyrhizobium icense]ANW00170.1 transporter [Bradyrhizobium icense]